MSDYLELNYVAQNATGRGINKVITLEKIDEYSFKYIEGRIGIRVGPNKPKVSIKSMSEWDIIVRNKLDIGYTITKTEKMKKVEVKKSPTFNGKHFKPIENRAVSEIIERLISFTRNFMDSSYTIKVENISDEMIKLGKTLLDGMADNYKDMSVDTFNEYLCKLYSAIPRRIDNLRSHLAKSKDDFVNILAKEQEIYDVTVSSVRDAKIECSANKTILETYGISVRPVTDSEKNWIIKKMGSQGNNYVQAYKVINFATEKKFNNFCEKNGFTDKNGIERLFHGSRSENFWSIITTGLTINPKGVVITGKMFGNGTYFAPDAIKSMGYTDRHGSKWANGTSATGFLAIYKVAVGNSCDPNNATAYTYKSLSSKGYHSVWCKRGGQTGLRMDEVVVYQDCQDTIEYLIEVK